MASVGSEEEQQALLHELAEVHVRPHTVDCEAGSQVYVNALCCAQVQAPRVCMHFACICADAAIHVWFHNPCIE